MTSGNNVYPYIHAYILYVYKIKINIYTTEGFYSFLFAILKPASNTQIQCSIYWQQLMPVVDTICTTVWRRKKKQYCVLQLYSNEIKITNMA